jgi:nucleotide sugar dehydrogenase
MSAKGNITIVGVGRLGICMALSCEKAGYNVLGVDVLPSYVESLNKKTFVSDEPGVTEGLRIAKNFVASTDLDEGLRFSDYIFVLVATPTGIGAKSYDHSLLSGVLSQINERKVKNKHIIVGCTVLPGYIAHTGRFLVRNCENTTLSYNPEFIAQGEVMKGLVNPDMVLIGEQTKGDGDWLAELYESICENKPNICRMSAESAEICKLSINCFITTKISFANMIGDIASKTENANATDILSAVGLDSRIGSKCLIPGYGFGGPCFPRDNRALGNYALSVGVEPIIPTATDAYNHFHAKFMVNQFLSQNKDEYVFEDVCYKPKCPVPIIEESQKLEVAKLLKMSGKKVIIKDREKVIKNVMLEFGSFFGYEIIDS